MFVFFKKVFIYLGGCIRSQLWHMGSFIAVHRPLSSCGMWAPECLGSVAATHGLSSCDVWAQELGNSVAVALLHVGSQFTNQGSNPHLLHWKAGA